MNKLIAVEACRCLSVIQDMIDTLMQLQCVTSVLISRVDPEQVFGKQLAEKLRETVKNRLTLEQAITDSNLSKAGGLKTRMQRIERRIQEATVKFTKDIHDLTMIFSQNTDFLEKVKQNVANIQEVLPQSSQQQMQAGGAGKGSVASGSVAGDQTVATGQGQGQNFSSTQELINLLGHFKEVVEQTMMTSVQEEQNKKQYISQLNNSLQNHINLLNTYGRDQKNLEQQIQQEEQQLSEQIKAVQEQLLTLAQDAENSVNVAFTQSSQSETERNDRFTKGLAEAANLAAENSRKMDGIVQKSLGQLKEMHKTKRRQYVSIRDDMKKLDAECQRLDEEIFRLRHTLNLSDARITVLNAEIDAYNKDKAIRDSQDKQARDVIERHFQFWDMRDLLEQLEADKVAGLPRME